MRPANDYYATPQALVDKWVESLSPMISQLTTVIDIGSGDGRIGNTIARMYDIKDLIKIDTHPQEPGIEPIDFLDWNQPDENSLYVSNPPFNLAAPILRRTMWWFADKSSSVSFLMRLGILGSRKRAEFWRDHPCTSIMPIVPRPSFTGGRTDNSEYAIYNWNRNRPGCVKPLVWR